MASRQTIDAGTIAVAELRCWGDFALIHGESGADLKPRGRKARALLAWLALHPRKPVSRERLTGLLWGDRADEQARTSLRQTLFELRGLARSGTALLDIDRETVALRPGAVRTDIETMQTMIERDNFAALLDRMPEPDDLLLANLDGIAPEFDDWLRIERGRRHAELLALIGDASASAVAAGQSRIARTLHSRLLELSGESGEEGPALQLPILPEVPAESAAPVLTAARRPVLFLAVAAALTIGGVAAGTSWWLPRRGHVVEAVHQEALGLYSSALPMIRDRNGGQIQSAVDILRRVVVLDPDFAKGWAALATAVAISSPNEQGRIEAERYARRSLALDPDLAEAHAALGMILGFAGPEAGAHLKRAAAINPRDTQTQFWLSNHYADELRFADRMQALRRAVTIDPFWGRAANVAATAAWELGHRDEATRYSRRLASYDPEQAFSCDYELDLIDGQYAAIVRKLGAVRARVRNPNMADAKLGATLLILGYTKPARLLLRLPDYQWRIAKQETLSRADVEQVETGSYGDWLDSHHFLPIAMQQLLRKGRAADLVDRFDRHGRGNLGALAAGPDDRSLLVEFGPDMALALRAVGREREAASLMARSKEAVRQAYASGEVPNWFDAAAAKLWAAQGRRAEALSSLARAIERGWHYAPLTPMPDIADIYAFRDLRGDPRFEALRNRLRDHIAGERRKLGPVPV